MKIAIHFKNKKNKMEIKDMITSHKIKLQQLNVQI